MVKILHVKAKFATGLFYKTNNSHRRVHMQNSDPVLHVSAVDRNYLANTRIFKT